MPSLQRLLSTGGDAYRVIAVYTQPDRPAGRGRKLRPGPVKQLAQEHDIAVYQPQRLRGSETLAEMRELQPDLMVVAAYGLLLPQAVLDLPNLGCINVHASLLPRWRGAAPVHYAILNGDPVTGCTLMQMEAGLDTGPMLCQRETRIGEHETCGELTARLAGLGADLLVDSMTALLVGALTPVAQNDERATHAPKIPKQAAAVDWGQPAVELERKIRAFNPWPVAQTQWDGRQLRLWQASVRTGADRDLPAGTVIDCHDDAIAVQTGDGVLAITELQMAGKRRTSAAAFVNAVDLDGVVLGRESQQ